MSGPSLRGRPRQKDVAELAGVSVQTVSNVLNARVDEMSLLTKARVEAAMKELNYVPNSQARSLRSQRTNTLAFLLLDPDPRYLADPMTDLIISGVGAVARERGYMVLVQAMLPGELDPRLFLPITQNGADGALLLLSGERELRRRYIKAMQNLSSHFVVFEDVDDPSVDTVTARNHDAAYAMTNHLISLGHERIGFIGTGTPWPMVEQRFEGYKSALRDAGIPFDGALTRFEGEWTAGTGEVGAANLCDEPDPPTSLLAGNDLLAVGAIKLLKARRIRVPEDFAIVGFDDFVFAEHVEPALTTVRVPGFEIGYLAASKLIDGIEGKGAGPTADSLPVELMMRTSA